MRQGEVIRTEDTDDNNYQNKARLNQGHKGDKNTKTKVKNRGRQRGI